MVLFYSFQKFDRNQIKYIKNTINIAKEIC